MPNPVAYAVLPIPANVDKFLSPGKVLWEICLLLRKEGEGGVPKKSKSLGMISVGDRTPPQDNTTGLKCVSRPRGN